MKQHIFSPNAEMANRGNLQTQPPQFLKTVEPKLLEVQVSSDKIQVPFFKAIIQAKCADAKTRNRCPFGSL